jgi:hypothetical protein
MYPDQKKNTLYARPVALTTYREGVTTHPSPVTDTRDTFARIVVHGHKLGTVKLTSNV